jgi:hypothetical protein
VLPDHGAGEGIDHGPGLLAQVLAQEALRVAVGDEADVVRVGLVGHAQAARGGLLPDPVLGHRPERQHRAGQLLGGEDGEHVRLVLAGVDRAAQHAGPPAGRGGR